MYIKKIKLFNFRNYEEQEIELYDKINIFYGDNAQGKTNILEAIYICALGKSFRTKREKELIKFDKSNTTVEIEFEKKDRDGKIKLYIDNKKTFFVNGIKIKKLSELLGNINIVMFSPDDISILKGGPENRRKFLDIMISQIRPNYIFLLNQYIKTLEQRNNYLRQIKFENKNMDMLDIWDEKLAELSEKIYKYRKEFIDKINNKIPEIHGKITEEKENIKMLYTSYCTNCGKLLEDLKKQRINDINKGYTRLGIHRDDFSIEINNKALQIFGSQGQHRSAILSLKITELEIIKEEIGEYPILLLDDFMSELDTKRKSNFLENIENIQVIITCTEKINKKDAKIQNIKNGKLE